MIPRHTIRGRRELSYTATSDSVALLLAVTVLIVRLHENDFYDIALLLTHIFVHTFTCILALIILKYTVASCDTIRLAIILYMLVAVVDAFALVGFIFLYALHNHKSSIDGPYALLRLVLGLTFLAVDVCGAFFVDLAYNYLDSLVYADNGTHLIGVAAHSIATKNFTTDAATGRVNSLHLTPKPLARTMNGYNIV